MIAPSTIEPHDISLTHGNAAVQPVTFGGCFGWLHSASGSGVRDIGVVLCQGVGRDASNAHRSFRILADRLAAAGYATLRFDYPGTGDSDEPVVELWDAWQNSLTDAVACLRARTGVSRLVFIGLRAGAIVATTVAAIRSDAVGLVLLEPTLRGKSYMTQLAVEARLRARDARRDAPGIEIDGLHLGPSTIERLSAIDLRQTVFGPGFAVAAFTQAPSSLLSACAAAWQAQGAAVAIHGFDGLGGLLRPSHLADEPLVDVTPIVAWLEGAIPTTRVPLPIIAPSPATLRPTGCVETAIRFGTENTLFGILCRSGSHAPVESAVVICNTGGDPHHGFARFSVRLARRLASEGVASLRLDFAGMGDSPSRTAEGDEDVTHVFSVDRRADIAAAVTALQAAGYRRFAVNGLCSGAYHAFQAAVSDERIDAQLLVNLPWFSLRYDRPGPASVARNAMRTLSQRQVSSLMLFAERDAGLTALNTHFGEGGADLPAFPGATAATLADVDHDLTTHAMQDVVTLRMIAFLRDLGWIPAIATSRPAMAACYPVALTAAGKEQSVESDQVLAW
ncbi:MAG TPA: alpha/beta fold hydrolase [Acetobacteraceae bacterium]|nr:alpha/beta fold hydrolase [Acetobacteraceae bacterium]